jgi:hypothetical protein
MSRFVCFSPWPRQDFLLYNTTSPQSIYIAHSIYAVTKLLITFPKFSSFPMMSSIKAYSYPGFGEWAKENMHYSQAVRVADRIHCSGQGE